MLSPETAGNLAERFAQLPELLSGHLQLSLSALAVGTALSIPLGVAAARLPRFGGPVLGFTALVQTIPSMALLALMVPLLGGTIGFLPAFLALVLYSMLPTLRNTATGILGVDARLVEAARGVGMTDRQRLFRIELPLALPVIIAGLRTATVWVVGTATLATPVGARSLGDYIFSGLQTRNWLAVVFGCFFAALLAIVLDQIIRLLERAARERRRRLGLAALAALAAVVVGGLFPLLQERGIARGPDPEITEAADPERHDLTGTSVTIGAKTFTEQFILASLLEQRLDAAGAKTRRLRNLGSTILFDALARNTVDVYVDYTGTVWTTLMKRERPIERTAMFIEVAHWLREHHGVLTLGRLGFENAYALAMRRERAAELGVRSIADLARLGDTITIGGDPEFFARPEWTGVRGAYGLDRTRIRSMDSTFMYRAVRDAEVDVISAYTTDGRVAAFDLVLLEDPRAALPPYDAILLLSPRAAGDPALIRALQPLLNRIDNRLMRSANRQVDLDGRLPVEAARQLLDQLDG